MYGMMFKPPNIEPGVKYPTLLFLYGGPHVQVSQARKIVMVNNLLVPHSLPVGKLYFSLVNELI